jgi:hypothetical protein
VLGRLLRQVEVLDAHHQRAAVGHGVAGVEHEVHHHLLELAPVGGDVAAARRGLGRLHDELDVLADHAAEHRREPGDHLGDREHGRLHHAAAAEGEDLPREAGGAAGRVADHLDVLARRGAVREVGKREVGGAQDAGEHVVEVVRDAAGEPAQRSIFCARRSCSCDSRSARSAARRAVTSTATLSRAGRPSYSVRAV